MTKCKKKNTRETVFLKQYLSVDVFVLNNESTQSHRLGWYADALSSQAEKSTFSMCSNEIKQNKLVFGHFNSCRVCDKVLLLGTGRTCFSAP